MSESTETRLLLDKKRECLIQARAFEIWMDFLTPIRWITIFIGVLFPALAGFSVLQDADILGIPWKNIAATLTFTTSIVTAIHTALHCDAHQAACKKLTPLYSALADDFAAATSLDEKPRKKKAQELIKRLADLKKSTTETPMRWATKKAKAEIP